MNSRQILKKLMLFSIPLILSGLLQQMFSWVDAFIVGNFVGERALASIGATGSIYSLFINLMVGFTSGLSVLAAQDYGGGNMQRVRQILSGYSGLLGVVFGIVALIGLFFSNGILRLMDTPQTLMADAGTYIRILFVAVPFLAVYNTYSAVLRSLGNSRAPFIAVVISSVVNALLDLLLVAVFRFGTAGAAVATAASQIAMTIYIIFYACRKYPSLRFHPFRMGKGKPEKDGYRYGIPPAVQSGVTSVGNLILQRFMNGLGENTVAAITTAYRVDSVLLLPIVNFSTGISTMVAQNIGAGDKETARKIFKLGSLAMAVISIVLTLVILVTGEFLISIFGLTAESVRIGDDFFKAIAGFYIVFGLSMAIRGYLEGTSDLVFSGVTGILTLVVRIIGSYALVGVFGNMVIAYAEAIAWIFQLIVLSVRCRYSILKSRNV